MGATRPDGRGPRAAVLAPRAATARRRAAPASASKTAVAAAVVAIAILLAAAAPAATALPVRPAVLADGLRAARYWQGKAANHTSCGWERSVLMAGVMQLQRETGDEGLLQWARDFAEKYKWEFCQLGVGSINPDNQICAATYVDLYTGVPVAERNASWLAAVEEQYEAEMAPPQDGAARARHWSWVDSLFMGASVYGRMAAATGDARYEDFMLDQLDHALNQTGFALWSPSDRLFYRDFPGSLSRTGGGGNGAANAAPPPLGGVNTGPGVFWARGNGWAIAALATALQTAPWAAAAGDARLQRVLVAFKSHAQRLRELQGADGCWRVSLTDPEYSDAPETTGTALFTAAIAWGASAGLLSPARYTPVVDAAWKCLSGTALQPSGRVGFCQPGGDRPQRNVRKDTTSDFCVGQFAMAAAAVARLAPPNDTSPIDA